MKTYSIFLFFVCVFFSCLYANTMSQSTTHGFEKAKQFTYQYKDIIKKVQEDKIYFYPENLHFDTNGICLLSQKHPPLILSCVNHNENGFYLTGSMFRDVFIWECIVCKARYYVNQNIPPEYCRVCYNNSFISIEIETEPCCAIANF